MKYKFLFSEKLGLNAKSDLYGMDFGSGVLVKNEISSGQGKSFTQFFVPDSHLEGEGDIFTIAPGRPKGITIETKQYPIEDN